MAYQILKIKGVLVAVLLFALAFSVSATNISSCSLLNSSSTVYVLTSSVNSSGTCMTIGAANVTLDCQGNNINYSRSLTGYGINNTGGYYKITVKNCKITQGSSSSLSYGIFFSNSSTNGNIFNNSISTTSMASSGIYLSSSSSNNVSSNNISATGMLGFGIQLDENSQYNTVNSNVIYTAGNWAYGILVDSSFNNNLSLNNISTLNTNAYGISFQGDSDTNTVTNSSIRSSLSYAVYMGLSSGNNRIFNNLLNGSDSPALIDSDSSITYWNTTSQNGTRVHSNGNLIGGNYYTNSAGNGYSDNCVDNNYDGFCDSAYNISSDSSCTVGVNCSNNTDFLPYSTHYSVPLDCGTLGTPNTIYNLTQNISSAGTCFTIAANNVTIECRGFTITYSQSLTGYAVNNSGGFNRSTIKNCKIAQGSNQPESSAIITNGMNNGTILNNNISTSGLEADGIILSSGSRNNLSSNTISTSGAASLGVYVNSGSSANRIFSNNISTLNDLSHGIYIYSSSGNNLSSNIISTSGDIAEGIELYNLSSRNNIFSNTVYTSGSNSNGLILQNSSSNILSLNAVYTSGLFSYAVSLYNSSNNMLANSIIKSSLSYAAYLSEPSANNSFYNNLLNGSAVPVSTDSVYINYWNTSNQAGIRIYSNGTRIGGNYYTNSTGNGFSDICNDSNLDGFCDNAYNVSTSSICIAGSTCGNNTDYLPYSTQANMSSCILSGNFPPCETVTLKEVVDEINLWIGNDATLAEVVRLINAWVGNSGS